MRILLILILMIPGVSVSDTLSIEHVMVVHGRDFQDASRKTVASIENEIRKLYPDYIVSESESNQGKYKIRASRIPSYIYAITPISSRQEKDDRGLKLTTVFAATVVPGNVVYQNRLLAKNQNYMRPNKRLMQKQLAALHDLDVVSTARAIKKINEIYPTRTLDDVIRVLPDRYAATLKVNSVEYRDMEIDLAFDAGLYFKDQIRKVSPQRFDVVVVGLDVDCQLPTGVTGYVPARAITNDLCGWWAGIPDKYRLDFQSYGLRAGYWQPRQKDLFNFIERGVPGESAYRMPFTTRKHRVPAGLGWSEKGTAPNAPREMATPNREFFAGHGHEGIFAPKVVVPDLLAAGLGLGKRVVVRIEFPDDGKVIAIPLTSQNFMLRPRQLIVIQPRPDFYEKSQQVPSVTIGLEEDVQELDLFFPGLPKGVSDNHRVSHLFWLKENPHLRDVAEQLGFTASPDHVSFMSQASLCGGFVKQMLLDAGLTPAQCGEAQLVVANPGWVKNIAGVGGFYKLPHDPMSIQKRCFGVLHDDKYVSAQRTCKEWLSMADQEHYQDWAFGPVPTYDFWQAVEVERLQTKVKGREYTYW